MPSFSAQHILVLLVEQSLLCCHFVLACLRVSTQPLALSWYIPNVAPLTTLFVCGDHLAALPAVSRPLFNFHFVFTVFLQVILLRPIPICFPYFHQLTLRFSVHFQLFLSPLTSNLLTRMFRFPPVFFCQSSNIASNPIFLVVIFHCFSNYCKRFFTTDIPPLSSSSKVTTPYLLSMYQTFICLLTFSSSHSLTSFPNLASLFALP